MALNFECTTKELTRPLTHVVYILIRSIPTIPPFSVRLLHDLHAEICPSSQYRYPRLHDSSELPLKKVVIWSRSSCWYLIWLSFLSIIRFDLSMPSSESHDFCDTGFPAAASLSGTEAPLFGEGPRLCGLPFVVVDCALASVMLV